MSGIEVAGLVCGALPLLLAGLQFYAEGIAVTRRYWRYRGEVDSLREELEAESAVYQNSIEILLLGIVESKDVAEFIASPGGELWRTASFERRLKKRLGTSYDPYLNTILKLQATTDKFKERLKLSSSGQPRFSQPQAFKEHYKRLKFSLSKADYEDLIDAIRHANTVLHRLTFQRSNIESYQRAGRTLIPDFRTINERAQGFSSILSSGWTCSCQSNHSVSLRLERRIDDALSDEDDDNDGMRDPFHVLFQYGYPNAISLTVNERTWTWDEADIHVTCKRPLSISGASDHQIHGGRGVRFTSQAKRAIKAALEPEPNLQSIKDLCSAIQTLQKPQRDVCLTLLEREIAKQKYGLIIYPTKMLPENTAQWSVCTLRKALQRGRRFPKRDRVRVAVILASSVLQLYETPWLDDDWGIDSVYFIERPGCSPYDEPFVSSGLVNSDLLPPKTAPKRMGRMIRNQTLFALGVALIELWYGETLSELHEDDDGPMDPLDLQNDLLTRFNTADRLADELADDAGTRYSDAVRSCIRCDFNVRVKNLKDVQFQRAVFQGVVAKLKESYDFMV